VSATVVVVARFNSWNHFFFPNFRFRGYVQGLALGVWLGLGLNTSYCANKVAFCKYATGRRIYKLYSDDDTTRFLLT